MATQQDLIDNFRMYTGEVIPEDGSAADTLFTDEWITTTINATPSMDAAVLEGWKVKQAHFANLVNVIDGAAARTFSDLFLHASNMVAQYTKLAIGPTYGRTRVGKIVRQ